LKLTLTSQRNGFTEENLGAHLRLQFNNRTTVIPSPDDET
jgi:hypothetical protein